MNTNTEAQLTYPHPGYSTEAEREAWFAAMSRFYARELADNIRCVYCGTPAADMPIMADWADIPLADAICCGNGA